MAQRTVLLVEDDVIDKKRITKAFMHHKVGFDLTCVSNGIEALEVLQRSAVPMPLVVLTDLKMPKMDGLAFLREVRQLPRLRSLPVVVLTTSDDPVDKQAAYDLNVAGYIVKPLEFEGLVAAIGTLNEYWSLCAWPS